MGAAMPSSPPPPGAPSEPAIPIGVSACLLGAEVRHDGSHRRARYLTDTLGPHLRFVAVCPEVEVGMGTPRESLRLVTDPAGGGPRLVAPRSGRDWTEAMRTWAAERVERLAPLGLRGFVLKARSPSCGPERVRVYDRAGPTETGTGLFADALRTRFPLMPIEDEGRLNDARLRENFVLRVFVLDEWLSLRPSARPADLVAFHTRHKILVLAHDPARGVALGRLVARSGATADFPALLDAYADGLMTALARPARPKRQINAMQHLAGVVKRDLDPADKAELAALLDDYRAGRVPVAVPMTLLRHHLRRNGNDWAGRQSYLAPYPRALGLRSHV